MLHKVTLILAVLASIIAAAGSHAQPLPVIGNDPRFGPICAGPLGPGPCADVARYLAMQQQVAWPPGGFMGQGPSQPSLQQIAKSTT